MVGTEPLAEQSRESFHRLVAGAARLFNTSRQGYGEGIGSEENTALRARFQVQVHLMDELFRKGVLKKFLEEF